MLRLDTTTKDKPKQDSDTPNTWNVTELISEELAIEMGRPPRRRGRGTHKQRDKNDVKKNRWKKEKDNNSTTKTKTKQLIFIL